MKKVWMAGILLAGSLSAAAVGVRIWHVNQDIALPEIRESEIGERVALLDNYFLEEYEICEGYELRVDDAELLPVEEYLEKHGLSDKETWEREHEMTLPDQVYDLTLTFFNTNTEETECGIDLYNYALCAADYTIPFCDALYAEVNSDKAGGSPMFSLRPDSEATLFVPYGVFFSGNGSYLDERALDSRNLYYVVSLYPVQNQIRIRTRI